MSSLAMRTIFDGCDVKGGIGLTDAPIAVIYGVPGAGDSFPYGEYLEKICKEYGFRRSSLYITPIIKDRKANKPASTYVDLLINELAVVNPRVAVVLGQIPLTLLGYGNPGLFYRHVYGMFMPFLIRDFFALNVVEPHEFKGMPDKIKHLFHKRMTEAAKNIQTFLEGDSPYYFQPKEDSRGDLLMLTRVVDKAGFKVDNFQANEYFLSMWSEKIYDYVFVCRSERVKQELLKLGYGVVLTKEEVGEVSLENAEFVAMTMKSLRTRKIKRS